jgi:hypothetical protein
MKEIYMLLVSMKKNGIYGPIENGKKYPSLNIPKNMLTMHLTAIP